MEAAAIDDGGHPAEVSANEFRERRRRRRRPLVASLMLLWGNDEWWTINDDHHHHDHDHGDDDVARSNISIERIIDYNVDSIIEPPVFVPGGASVIYNNKPSSRVVRK